jgi:hypothetical protein
MSSSGHNLNIKDYTLAELYGLLKLPRNPTKDQLKAAWRTVTKFHPDRPRKTPISPDYFIFYKQVYEIVERNCGDVEKTTKPVKETSYATVSLTGDDEMDARLQARSKKMTLEEFNQLYESNAAHQQRQYRNDWFQSEADETGFQTEGKVTAKNMNQAFHKMRQAKQQSLTTYKGIQDVTYYGQHQRFYDDDADADGSDYITTDPFAKFKYEDIRRVYKDQPINEVSELDYDSSTQYKSVEEYERTRHLDAPTMSKEEALKILNQRELEKQRLHDDRKFKFDQRLDASNQRLQANYRTIANGGTLSVGTTTTLQINNY